MTIVVNRVWDSELTGSVYWKTNYPDKVGIHYPGPGTFGTHTSDYVISSIKENQTIQKAQLHDLSYGADDIYQFNGNLIPEVGVIGTATMQSGQERYCQGLIPGTLALRLDGVDDIVRLSASPTPTLNYNNNFTIEMLIKPLNVASAGTRIISHGNSGETEATNFTYMINILTDNQISYFYENGSGVDNVFATNHFLSFGRWHHLAYTRRGGINKLYVNGEIVDRSIGNTGTGGSTGILTVGGDFGGTLESHIAIQSLKFIPSALTPKQILAEARRTLGPDFRP